MKASLVSDPVYGPAACSACRAPVVWVLLSEDGQRLAIDPEPHAAGDLLYGLEEDAFGDAPEPGVVRARRATSDDPDSPRWRAHACKGAS